MEFLNTILLGEDEGMLDNVKVCSGVLKYYFAR